MIPPSERVEHRTTETVEDDTLRGEIVLIAERMAMEYRRDSSSYRKERDNLSAAIDALIAAVRQEHRTTREE